MAHKSKKSSKVEDDKGKASVKKTVEFKIFDVKEKQQLKTLLEKNKIKLEKGRAYFELTKSETVQDYKQLVVMKKADQSFIAGYAVRYALKIPEETDNEFELDLETVPDFAVFVQSTSYNRNVLPNTRILYDMREAGMGKGMGEAGAEDAAAAAALAETARALRLVAEQFGSVGPGATDAELQEVLDDLRAMGVSKPALPPSVAALWRAAGFFHFTQDPDSHWGFNICGARQAVDITDGFASNRIDWCKWALEEGRLFSVGDPGWLYIASSMCDMYVSWFCCFDSESPHFGKVHTISTHDGELGWDADDMMVYAERILNWYRQGWKRRALMDCVWGRRYDENNAQYETSDDGSYGNSDDNEDGEE